MDRILLLASLLASCGGDDTGAGTPDIAVSPERLVFWDVPLGYAEFGVVQVGNDGDAPLHLESPAVVGSGDFVVSAPAGNEVQPRSTKDLVVRFTPSTDAASATLEIASDDPDTPVVEVTLTGSTGPDPTVDADGDGYTPGEGDCDETDAAVHPGANEACNGVDDDCDGSVDEVYDADGDGYIIQTCLDGGDCDDANPEVNPEAVEVRNDVDDDCDGFVDDETTAWDDDGDCFCEEAPCQGSVSTACTAPEPGDCDDAAPDVHPDQDDLCDDDVDNDCDGVVDDGSEPDADGDGWRVCEGDCDDADAVLNPDTTWYVDDDEDGYGWSLITDTQCEEPEGYVLDDTDCYDRSADACPGQTEYFDTDRGDASYDYDCDGQETGEYTATFSCTGTYCTTHTDGWTTGAPECGESGTWATSCYRSGTTCVASGTSTRTQSCR